ncbi:MAG: hypothetical protein U0P45_04735 [Acidimicrobiales bacterium]
MRVWVIRGGEQNRLVDDFVASGSVGLAYPEVPNVRTVDRWDIERRLEDTGTPNVDLHADILLAFVHEVVSGDAVVLPDPGRGEVVVGVFDGPYEHRPEVDEERGQHRRRVAWLGRHATKDLPEALQDVGRQRPALKRRDSAAFAEHLEQVRSGALGRPADQFERPRAPRAPGSAPRRTSAPRAARASAPARPAKAEPAVRTCPSCFQQKPVALFDEDGICRDCA